MTRRALVARMDNFGDVLLAGPCVRAVAAHVDSVTLLSGPRGRAAADLLPGVDQVVTWCAPWIDLEPPAVAAAGIEGFLDRIRALDLDLALILTSFHQSPLPLALLLRMAGVPWIGAISEDYPGSLLDLRHRVEGDPPEAERALSLAEAAGFRLPPGTTGNSPSASRCRRSARSPANRATWWCIRRRRYRRDSPPRPVRRPSSPR